MYELGLVDLVDDDGLTFSFYHFEALDEAADEWPWLHGIEFSSPPPEKIKPKIDFSDPDAGEFADCIGSNPPLMTARFDSEPFSSVVVSRISISFPSRSKGLNGSTSFPGISRSTWSEKRARLLECLLEYRWRERVDSWASCW